MKNLILHIRYLLRCHDCVTIPGFGAFIATNVPALIDEDRGLFLPPSRYISFNCEINHNDGLIASSIARRDGISFETASLRIDKAVEQIRREISLHGSLDIQSIGTIKADNENRLHFIPEIGASAFNPFAVLDPVVISDTAGNNNDEDIPEGNRKPRILRIGANAIRYAASVAITVSLGALLFFPLRDSGTIPVIKAAFWPASASHETENTATFEVREISGEMHFAPAPAEIEPEVATIGLTSFASPDDAARYGVVVGVFSSEDKAIAFIDGRDNLDYAPSGKSLFRVYAAKTATKEEAAAIAADMRASGIWPEAWPATIR